MPLPWAETGCIAPLIVERTGMSADRLAALNAEITALRRAMINDGRFRAAEPAVRLR